MKYEEYDYVKAIADDLENEIINDSRFYRELVAADDEDKYDMIQERFWDDDAVTGNGAYGYDTDEVCLSYVLSNIRLLKEAINEFCTPASEVVDKLGDWSYFDATIRCYVFPEAISRVIGYLFPNRQK